LGNILEKIIPGDHEITAKAVGEANLFKLFWNAFLAYRRTMKYLVTKRGFNAFKAFIYTKTIVPTGEGSGEAAYYFIGPILRKFPQLAPYPRWVEIEITTKCNKHCIICEHTYWKEPSQDLTFEQFCNIVDMFPKLIWVNLTGEGDAFLNRDYLKMIRYLKERDVAVYLVDSFNLITKDIAYELVRLGVDGIYISMDAAARETYEKIKVGCKFENTIRNIKNLLEAKKALNSPIPEICFRYVITTLNLYEMPDFVRLVRNLAPRGLWGDMAKIHFVGLLTFPEIEHLYVPKIPPHIINETIKAVEESPDSLPAVFAHTEPEKFPSINKCLAWMEPYIMMGGYVLPCCAVLMSNKRPWLRKHALGNVLKQDFREIWNSPRYKRFRQAVTKPDAPVPLLCAGCRSYETTEREKLYGVDPSL
jgi:MoaA/NifB/PqqE/SkfB family radical SAM enzyme